MNIRFRNKTIRRLFGIFGLLSIFVVMLNLSAVSTTHAQYGVTTTPTVVPKETNAFQDTSELIEIDYSLGVFKKSLQQAINIFVSREITNLDTNEKRFIVTVQYEGANDIQHIRLIPASVYESNWTMQVDEDDIISLTAKLGENRIWGIDFDKLSINTSQVEIFNNPIYSFPWTDGQTWAKTHGFHSNNIGYSIDFAPRNGASNNVLAIESGVFSTYCYISSDTSQAMVLVTHSNGDKSGYLHLDKGSIPSGKFNQSIPKGTVIGSLYTGSEKYNAGPYCQSVIDKMKFATPCGCGSGTHLHFETNSLISIQGNSLSSISSASNGSLYTSNNGADTTPPTKTSNVRPNGWSGPYAKDTTPSFTWNPATDDDSGIAGYYVAVDDWTPEGGGSNNDWWVGSGTSATVPNALSDGQHIFAVTSKDNVGNRNPENTNEKGDAPYYTFYVDTHPPSGSFNVNNGDSVTYTTQVNIYSSVTDAISGVVEMRIRNGGETWGSWQPYSDHVIHELPSVTGQNYTVEIQYRDRVGNISSTYIQDINLNLYPERPSSTNYTLSKSTVGNTAWNHQSSHFQLRATSGQPSPVEKLNSPNFSLSSGYWSSITTTTCAFSGTIDLQSRTDDGGVAFAVGVFSTTTDASGNYELTVPTGAYDLTAEMDRYLDSERAGETCHAGETVQLPTVTLLGGDTNDDCAINILDLSFMGARFGLSDGDPDFDAKADINADGAINILDITVAGANFLETCPVPWP